MLTEREYMDAEAGLLLNEEVRIAEIADAIVLADTFRENTGLPCAVWARGGAFVVKRALFSEG